VRSDLKTAGVAKIETDLDELTCCFELAADVDAEELLDKLAESNSKMKGWSFAQ